ncbi:MAG TPA: hypothetical protein VK717_01785 [Opitutaceae bacterium]|jgi:hypothetical protein|nr:hypothetical protein [Opitutaceae bacterium]
MPANEPSTLEGLPVVLPPHLTANFEKADGQLRECYGASPGVPALVRLWLACGTSSRIRKEFESAVLDITKSNLSETEEDSFDDDSL